MNLEYLDFYSFLLGVITSLLIPIISVIYKYVKRAWEFNKIKTMILEEYFKPIKAQIEVFPQKTTLDDLTNCIGEKSQRISYLLTHEIEYLNSENQFKIIRTLEYTKMYYKKVSEILKEYSFKSCSNDKSVYEKVETEKREKLDKINRSYQKTLNSYIKMERDSLT